MTPLDAAWWVVCVVLVVSGAAKLFEPGATDSTLAGLGLRAPRGSGRLLGAVEVVLGAAGLLATPGAVAQVVAVLVALLYLCFAVVVFAARRGGLVDCGCLGVRSRAPSLGHVVLDVAFGAVAAAAALAGPSDRWGGLASLPTAAAVAVAVAVAALAGLVVARI